MNMSHYALNRDDKIIPPSCRKIISFLKYLSSNDTLKVVS